MKTNFRNAFLLLGAIALTTAVSCTKDDEANSNTQEEVLAVVDQQPSSAESQCGYVDGNWSSSAVLSTTIGTSSETNFMNTQNSRIASVWGRPAVTLRFVKDPSNPGSTYNAISYSYPAKIYYGEAIYKAAKAKSSDKSSLPQKFNFHNGGKYP